MNDHDTYVSGLGSTINKLQDVIRAQQVLIDSYRTLTPRLIAQTDNARREAQGRRPRPVDCTETHPTRELVCLREGGHSGCHSHEAGSLQVSWS